MGHEHDQHRNEWSPLTQGPYFQSHHQQDYAPEVYAPVEGYSPVQGHSPAGSSSEYSNYTDSCRSSYGSPETEELNTFTDDDDDISEEETRNVTSTRRQKRKSKTAQPKKEQPKSRRAIRRERVASENNGEVSATDNPKGLVEWQEGVFKWWDPEETTWLNAAFHDEYRDEFLFEDSAEGTYVVAPECGKGNDVTSPCSAFNQLEWRLSDRDSWDNIVDADGNKVLYLLERPVNQSYDLPERLWIHDGCVLLDGDNNPVRPWVGVPRCFSSKIEGGRIEAIRRILPMTIQDFRARMLRHVPTGRGATKPLSYPSTFGHRSSRFRATYQCIAWASRAASDVLRKQITDLLPEAEEATTTKGLRKLTQHEVESRKNPTRNQFLYKANGRAISEEEREAREKKLNNKLARQVRRHPTNTQRQQSTLGQPASPSPYLPTPPLSAGKKRRRKDDLGGFEDRPTELPAKRARFGISPLDPRVQGPFRASRILSEETSERSSNAYEASRTVSPDNSFYDESGFGVVGHGLSFRQNPIASQNNDLAAHPPHLPEATNTAGTLPTTDPLHYDTDLDYRYVTPQSPLEQLRIQAALFYSRTHYYKMIGEHPPYTSEGTYTEQYFQILTLLNQKLPETFISLADVGPWHDSFNNMPTPTLPEDVLWTILQPFAGTLPCPEARTTENITQVSSANGSAENFQTAQSSDTGLNHDKEVNGWSDDFFSEYLDGDQDADADEDVF